MSRETGGPSPEKEDNVDHFAEIVAGLETNPKELAEFLKSGDFRNTLMDEFANWRHRQSEEK